MPGEVEQKVVDQSTEVKPEVESPKEDIVSRVSQSAEATETEDIFNINDIEKIENPQARDYAQKAYKSFEKGYQKKYQDLAEQRKGFEQKLADMGKWSPERIQKELLNPEFVQAARAVAGTQEQETEESAVTIENRRKIQELEAQITNAGMVRQDEVLRTKYKDYDSKVVNSLIQDLQTGKIKATREDLWKILNFDKYTDRAYQLGKKDKNLDLTEKIESTSVDGIQATASGEVLKPEKNEKDEVYFMRLALKNLQEHQTGANKPKKE